MKKQAKKKHEKKQAKIERCSRLSLHNFPNTELDTTCRWCGKTVRDLRSKEVLDYSLEIPTPVKKIEIDVDQTTQNAINLAFVAGLVVGIIIGVMI